MEQIKQIELNILKEFIKICDKLNLKYYLIAGSLIGAIRHGGFIPWDDDIDIAMPRDDYEILIKQGSAIIPSNLFIQTYKTDSEYFLSYAKIRNLNTSFVEKNSSNLKTVDGIFIDIFPLDYFKPSRCFAFKMKILRKVVFFSRSLFFDNSDNKKIFRKTIKKFFSIFGITPQKICTFYDKKILKIKKTKFVNNYSSNYGFKESCPIDWFGDGKHAKFEGINVRIPMNYDEYLKKIYGDYMILPPLEKRVSNHPTVFVDYSKVRQ